MSAFVNAFVLPERAFGDERTYHISRVLILLLLFVLYATGSALVARFYATPYVAGLVMQQRETANARFAFGPPPGRGPGGQSTQNGRSGLATAAATPSPVVRSIGIVVRSLLFLLSPLLTWWLLVIFVQFLGGEEEKTEQGPHRNSRYLLWYAWIPLALRRLAEGVLIQFQDPAAAWSALNLEQYRRQSAVSFSLLSVIRLPDLPQIASYLLYNLTDPFFLWFLFIIAYGGKTVFRISQKKGYVIAGFVLTVLYLERVVFAAVGISTGV